MGGGDDGERGSWAENIDANARIDDDAWATQDGGRRRNDRVDGTWNRSDDVETSVRDAVLERTVSSTARRGDLIGGDGGFALIEGR